MTTTVKVHVNGNYRATVKQFTNEGEEAKLVREETIEPQEEKTFNLHHTDTRGTHSTFDITEEYLGSSGKR